MYSICAYCKAFINYEKDEGKFALGFFCPIVDKLVLRDDFACENILGDGLPF